MPSKGRALSSRNARRPGWMYKQRSLQRALRIFRVILTQLSPSSRLVVAHTARLTKLEHLTKDRAAVRTHTSRKSTSSAVANGSASGGARLFEGLVCLRQDVATWHCKAAVRKLAGNQSAHAAQTDEADFHCPCLPTSFGGCPCARFALRRQGGHAAPNQIQSAILFTGSPRMHRASGKRCSVGPSVTSYERCALSLAACGLLDARKGTFTRRRTPRVRS